MTCHHYQYQEETEVAANDEHLPSSPMRGEIGNPRALGDSETDSGPQQALLVSVVA